MPYQTILEILGQCGLGALLLSRSGKILYANQRADEMLHGDGALTGVRLHDLAPGLLDRHADTIYTRAAFGEYLLRCPTPAMEDFLPPNTRLVVFRDATNDACHDMLLQVLDRIDEAVVLCDCESRIWQLNDAAVRLDSLVTQDVRGETIDEVYCMLDGTQAAVPRAIQSRRPLTNLRQYYGTRYGKRIDVVSGAYPIVQDGQVLGGFSMLKDWSEIDNLNRKIIDLQAALLERDAVDKPHAKSALCAKFTFNDIIFISHSMSAVIAQCRQAARSDSSVMLYGETGTGKELFAQSIHNASRRAEGPFLAINCAAIPENLLESLLFGTEKGAYTGAERRPGLFEQASGGTLLLDEINSMQIGLQSKLLRVLQDGVIRRVGGTTEIQVDVRVLSNINQPPDEAIAANHLRQDLFYRLGVVTITIPPLRARKEDIPLLAKHFIMECNHKLLRNVGNLDAATAELFQAYDWPGNVRELQHAIEHAMNVLPDELSAITPEFLPARIRSGSLASTSPDETDASFLRAKQSFARSTLCKVLRAKQRQPHACGPGPQNEPTEPAILYPPAPHRFRCPFIRGLTNTQNYFASMSS